ncbi:hypothetical protein DFP72DRAFT_889960 [Ephemerocybe angulata]|uniref:Uncharacterized protein n=1 Tax=Ephemerocybe angulata TaxID=980116 RepID=A0A8H6M7V7_9AGAR|nr:hypothetical protein DFP72DRAFT_889960 [Tulosesus angulatus]
MITILLKWLTNFLSLPLICWRQLSEPSSRKISTHTLAATTNLLNYPFYVTPPLILLPLILTNPIFRSHFSCNG